MEIHTHIHTQDAWVQCLAGGPFASILAPGYMLNGIIAYLMDGAYNTPAGRICSVSCKSTLHMCAWTHVCKVARDCTHTNACTSIAQHKKHHMPTIRISLQVSSTAIVRPPMAAA